MGTERGGLAGLVLEQARLRLSSGTVTTLTAFRRNGILMFGS